MNHLTALKSAEAATIAALDNATAELTKIGTDVLADALERFQQAANAAAERLAGALPKMAGIADGAVESIKATVAQIAAAFTLPTPAERKMDTAITACEEPEDKGDNRREEMEQQPDEQQPQTADSDSEQTAPAAMTDAEFIGAVKRIIVPERPRERQHKRRGPKKAG